MLAAALAGALEGSWLRADRQTAGRGRQGRAWESPTGNLYASTLVRLRPTDPPAATLSLVAGVALEEVVTSYLGADRGVALKWPNDLLIGRAKLAGILLERAEDAVVAGIGVNLAHHPDLPERPTTSLAAQGVAVAPTDFIETLAESFARWLRRWRGEGLAPVRDRWAARAHPVGTALRVGLPGGEPVDGLFEGLTGDGALMLRLADGRLHVMHAGDVFLV
ncbi:biotin--[acetyl-CoA-carboxylase] ligase [Sphingomonas qomolangmaensis]|uniref:biotin--[biotin carboxyl-carrier protein] ligase n=1 Tax=Sphingomonas qomolangmaensis TaxID=2918765 RepID=A0ABY5LE55_9SPHN|nr:biotin--[acetyl-CoA-carboxylase] ligase [Sphingomonas qomolangmaensis]UUL84161.1 biotin--[acetyl-CoA-carboxylase] ligase [Sphingomonas qomolangmaensis]